MGRVYEPAEDSLLLLRHVERRVYGKVLDMGTGSGILAIAAASRPKVSRVVAIDINRDAVEMARRRAMEAGVSNKIEFRVGDLFEGLGNRRFDWIIFNPPYLPSEGGGDKASWSGGQMGREVIERFLSKASKYLKPNGAILLVYSTLTELDIERVGRSYHVYVLEEMALFFERLFCVLLRPFSPS